MKKLNEVYEKTKKLPNKVLQFGEGNFLRGFVDWQIDILNKKCNFNAGVVVIRPIDSNIPPSLNTQEGLYTTIIRGLDEKGNLSKDYRIIDCINEEVSLYKDFDRYLQLAKEEEFKYIFSNTTEAGIVFDGNDTFEGRPQKSFPAKLTRFLFQRYENFKGDKEKGFIIIPCELIDYNGEKLKEIVLKYAQIWHLEKGFIEWLEKDNVWCSTLVDRIVTGFPWEERESLEKELGYKDDFMVSAECFYLFVIQGPKCLEEELKVHESGLNIKIVEDIQPYKMRKVAILNGGHTAIVPISYLYGNDTVLETMQTPELELYLKELINLEIIPTLNLPQEELEEFSESVLNRFRNPYIHHQLISISLNSMFKFKTRILPQLLKYREIKKTLPKRMVFSLASLIVFYKGTREGVNIPLNDDKDFLDLFKKLWSNFKGSPESAKEIGDAILGLKEHWGENLLEVEGLSPMLGEYIYLIEKTGMKNSLKEIL